MPHCCSVVVPDFVACMSSATWKYTSNEAMFSAPTLDKARTQTPARLPAQAIPSSDSVLAAHPLFPGGEIEEGLFMALKNYSEFGMALDPSSMWLLLSKKDQVRQWCRSMKPLRSLNLPEVISHLSASRCCPAQQPVMGGDSSAREGQWHLGPENPVGWLPVLLLSAGTARLHLWLASTWLHISLLKHYKIRTVSADKFLCMAFQCHKFLSSTESSLEFMSPWSFVIK